MATPALIDVDALLGEIPGDDPAGIPLAYMDQEQLNEFRREVNPDDFPVDDPRRPPEKRADWPKIIDMTKKLLTGKSKDLRIAARLTEALTKRYGFGGLRDGLRLMRRLMEDCGERLHPVVEGPDDLERRAGAFNWLDDPDRAARFPTSLRQLPLVSIAVRGEPPYEAVSGYSYNDWKVTEGGEAAVPAAEFERTARATPALFLQTLKEDMEECEQEIKTTVDALTPKLESYAPALTEIRSALANCKQAVLGIMQNRPDQSGGGAVPAEAAEVPGGQQQMSGGTVVVSAAVGQAVTGNREGVYRQIAQLAGVLKQMEPHSPIPYLLERAVELGRMPFPLLIKQLIRDMNQLNEVNREFGIKDAEKPSE